MLSETQWAESVKDLVGAKLARRDRSLSLLQGAGLTYAHEVLDYKDTSPSHHKGFSCETDLLVVENISDGMWKPRVVIECKFMKVTTHDAITYSEKALSHKRVHPYLRYGILIGNRRHYPLPGRLFRHGLYFDFMLSWTSESPSSKELKNLLVILLDEVEASRNLEEMLYNSRSNKRRRYVVLHKPLRLS